MSTQLEQDLHYDELVMKMHALQKEYDQFKAENKKKDMQLKTANEQLRQLKVQRRQLTDKYDMAFSQAQGKDRSVEVHSSELKSLKSQVTRLQDALGDMKSEVMKKDEENSVFEHQNRELQVTNTALEAELTSVKALLREKEVRLSATEAEYTEFRNEALEYRKICGNKIVGLQNELRLKDGIINQMQAEFDLKVSELSNSNTKRDEYKEEVLQWKTKLSGATKAYEQMKTNDKERKYLDEQTIKQLESDKNALIVSNISLKDEVNHLSKELEKYQSDSEGFSEDILDYAQGIEFDKEKFDLFIERNPHLVGTKQMYMELVRVQEEKTRLKKMNQDYVQQIKQFKRSHDSFKNKLNALRNSEKVAEDKVMEYRQKLREEGTKYNSLLSELQVYKDDNAKIQKLLSIQGKELNDARYQLQSLCIKMEVENQPLLTPPNASLSHADLAFDSIPALLTLNQNLTIKVRNLQEEIKTLHSKLKVMEQEKKKEVELANIKAFSNENKAGNFEMCMNNLREEIKKLEEDNETYKKLLLEKSYEDYSDVVVSTSRACEEDEKYRLIFANFRFETEYRIKHLEDQVEEHNQTAIKVNHRNEELETQLSEHTNRNEYLNNTLQASYREASKLRENLNGLHQQLCLTESDLHSLKVKYNGLIQVNHEQNEQLAAVNSLYDSITTNYKESCDKLESLQQKYDETSRKLKRAEEDRKQLMDDKAEIEDLKSEIEQSLSSELKETKESLAKAEKELNNFLSLDISSIIIKNEESDMKIEEYKRNISELKEKCAKYLEDKFNLEAEIKYLSKIGNELPQTLFQNDYESYAPVLLNQGKEVPETQVSIDNYKKIVSTFEETLAEVKEEFKTALNEQVMAIEAAKNRINEQTSAMQSLKEELKVRTDSINKIREEHSAEVHSLMSEKDSLSSELAEKEKMITTYSDRIIELNGIIDERNTEISSLRSLVDQNNTSMTENQVTIDKLKENINDLEHKLSDSDLSIKQLTKQLENHKQMYDSEMNSWREFKQSLAEDKDEFKNKIQLLIDLGEHIGDADKLSSQQHDVLSMMKNVENFLQTSMQMKEAWEFRAQKELGLRHSIEKELHNSNNEKESLIESMNTLKANNTDLINQMIDMKKYQDEYNSLSSQNDKLVSQNEDLLKKTNELLELSNGDRRKVQQLSSEIEGLKNQLTEAKSQIAVLTESEKRLTAHCSELLAKYKRKESSGSEDLKKELEHYKADLEKVVAEKSELEAKCTDFRTKAVERGRVAVEYKRRLAEMGEKAASVGTPSDNTEEVEKLIKEKESALEAQKEAEEDAKRAEASLKKRMEEYISLEQKFAVMIQKARHIQAEKHKISSLSSEQAKQISDLQGKLTDLEAKLAESSKTISENAVEVSRLKAMSSMATNKSNRMKKELDELRASINGNPVVPTDTSAATPDTVD